LLFEHEDTTLNGMEFEAGDWKSALGVQLKNK